MKPSTLKLAVSYQYLIFVEDTIVVVGLSKSLKICLENFLLTNNKGKICMENVLMPKDLE